MTYTSRTDQGFWSDPDFTESGVRMAHPYPTDYEPEPVPIYCAVCGDVTVENKGNACDRCINSDDDDMRTMAWAIRERDAVLGVLADVVTECAEVGRGDVKLLPCPFCGGEPKTQRNRGGGLHIFCNDSTCQLQAEIEGGDEGWDKETIAAWNTRPAPALTPKQAAADEMAKALTEANAWISRGDGLSPAKRGATCDTLNEAVEMIESALAKAGQP